MKKKFLVLLALMLPHVCQTTMLNPDSSSSVAIANYQSEYEKENKLTKLHQPSNFSFGRFQSPQAVKRALDSCRSTASSFKLFQGKDGRKGNVSSTKLGGDWVLAESEQIAAQCTTEEVLEAYLSGDLQRHWNEDTVLDCTITRQTPREEEAYYQQDLVLRSQRIIRRHTGIMRYSQRIAIDKVGKDDYCVSVRLDPSASTTTARKPFESLSVYVNLQQEGTDVRVYAAGLMQVNRKVVPNLIVFDASGIAGSMAGKGTLWLAAHFQERKLKPPVPSQDSFIGNRNKLLENMASRMKISAISRQQPSPAMPLL